MSPNPEPEGDFLISRREAIKRAGLFLGLTFSPSLLRGALAAPATTGTTPVAPLHLTSAQFSTLTAAAERIIPRTDTPGATDMGVASFIDFLCGDYLASNEQADLFAALQQLNRESGGMSFAALSPAEQDRLLTGLAGSSQPSAQRGFRQLRDLVVLGYFTAQPVGTTVLGYDPVPGRFDGCIPVSEVNNTSWYTVR